MSETTLVWGIKSSLLGYIATLEDGQVEVSLPATRVENDFNFQLDSNASDYDAAAAQGSLQFRGQVLITGYWGTMRIQIADPKLSIAAGEAELAIRIDSFTGETKFETIAKGEFDSASNTCTLRLTYGGQMILGQQYQVGQEINSATINWA